MGVGETVPLYFLEKLTLYRKTTVFRSTRHELGKEGDQPGQQAENEDDDEV